ncbi:hypothetical protein DSO57_1032855 [Entomophthora muscae]|uniref:Uncharacterized protein n=1 Tax=Entomophthora muscae TaxID=34485 RepID=A0ACC2SD65_9FUNG|nr:hypothetical protein DSO57_1032855 [Entomophthora muscae]
MYEINKLSIQTELKMSKDILTTKQTPTAIHPASQSAGTCPPLPSQPAVCLPAPAG